MTEESNKLNLRPYARKTDEERERLAQDIVAGKVWGPWNDGGDGSYVNSFMAWRLGMSPEYRDWMIANDVIAVYEYVREAGPLGINGAPCFMSHHHLDRADYEDVVRRRIEIERILGLRRGGSVREDDQAKHNQGEDRG